MYLYFFINASQHMEIILLKIAENLNCGAFAAQTT